MFELVRNLTVEVEWDFRRRCGSGIAVERIPAPHGIIRNPNVRLRGGTELHERAVPIHGAGLAEVVVPPFFVVALHELVQVTPKLLKPAVDQELRVDFDGLDLADFLRGDDNAPNDDSVATYSEMLEGPTIAQKLGAEVPLFRPIRFQALSSFLVSNASGLAVPAEQIEATSVDKGISTDRVPGKTREVQRDCEREFK